MELPDQDPRTRRSTTSFALLGLLSLRPWTTYELAKQVKRSLNWFWPRAERRLYEEPKRLVADGLATATREHTGRRPRTVYGITDQGRQALHSWLDEPPAPRSSEFEGMLKVFFADAGTLEQLGATLDAVEAEAADRLRALGAMMEQGLSAAAPFPGRLHLGAIGLRLEIEQETAVLRWARWARQETATWPSTRDAGAWDHRAVLEELLTRSRAELEPPSDG